MRSGGDAALVLWDVDGTLTSLVPDPVVLFVRNLRAFPAQLNEYPDEGFTHGRSERDIVREILRRNIGGRATEHMVTGAMRILQMKSAEIRAEYGRIIRPLPGIVDVLEWLRARQISTTVVTGNSFQAAVDKLTATGLTGLLEAPCGGYAEDRLDRHALIGTALARCAEWFGRPVARSRVLYVGDTPQDVEAARQAGVSSVAVGTGQFGVTELECHAPLASLRNLAVDGAKFRELVDRIDN